MYEQNVCCWNACCVPTFVLGTNVCFPNSSQYPRCSLCALSAPVPLTSYCSHPLVYALFPTHQAARKAKDNRRRAARQTSNVFAMFDQKQIAEFKEAFSMIDQNKDGFIDKQDLKDILADLSTCRSRAHMGQGPPS